jgi:hypothetical protein
MEVSSQPHAPATLLPLKKPPLTGGYEAGRAPEPIWTRWGREKIPAPARNRESEIIRVPLVPKSAITRTTTYDKINCWPSQSTAFILCVYFFAVHCTYVVIEFLTQHFSLYPVDIYYAENLIVQSLLSNRHI